MLCHHKNTYIYLHIYLHVYISLISKEANIWYIGENVLIIVHRLSLNRVPILAGLKPDQGWTSVANIGTTTCNPRQSVCDPAPSQEALKEP